MTGHSPDAAFSLNLGHNLLMTLRGHVRLFLGGRLRLAQNTMGPFTALCGLALVGVAVRLALLCVQDRQEIALFLKAARAGQPQMRSYYGLVATWAGVYLIFLFFWLPHNTFYRLFYFPALILLLGLLLTSHPARPQSAQRYRVLMLVAGIALYNWIFYISPYTKVNANEPLAMALRMNRLWPPGTVIYYATFSADNMTFRYFNPQTSWRKFDSDALSAMEADFLEVIRTGGTVWLDTTAIDLLSTQSEMFRKWLTGHTRKPHMYEFINDRHRILFGQVFPCFDLPEGALGCLFAPPFLTLDSPSKRR